MRKRTSRQRQREIAAKSRMRDPAQRRRRERRDPDAATVQWEVLRVAGATEASAT